MSNTKSGNGIWLIFKELCEVGIENEFIDRISWVSCNQKYTEELDFPFSEIKVAHWLAVLDFE